MTGVASHEPRSTSIKSFTDLRAWREAHVLAVKIYKVTQNFPKNEVFGLTTQIRRASVSVTSNIAEGFGRRSQADRLRFYDMARALLAEVQSQLLIARDVDYMDKTIFNQLAIMAVDAHKILTGLINATKGRDS
ncbi:MAG: four helix bundle protein [Candidatus Saccharimonadales bacterium]|jgi:four helix bundle protein